MAAQRFAKDPKIDRALSHSVRDGMAFSIAAGGGETYFSAFALYLRASAPEVALLTTLPSFVGALAQLLSAWAGQRLSRKFLILSGASLQAFLWLPILLLPALFPGHAIALLLAALTLFYAAANLVAPQWTSLMRDLVSDRRRGRYFGHRTRLTTLTSFAALVSSGVILHLFATRGSTYLGFATVFALAFVARAASVYHLSFLCEPPDHTPAPDMHVSHWWKALKATGAVGFSLYTVLMNCAVAIASPLFAVYMLRDLEFTYLEFMANTGASVFVQFLTLSTWGRLADVYGSRPVLIASSIAIPAVPALWLVSNDFWYLLAVQCFSGLAWAGFSLSAGNLLFELVPRARRAAYVAFHNVAAAGGIFAGAMVGALCATVLPRMPTLLGGAAAPASNLLYVFAISALARALPVVFMARQVPELRKPRRATSTQALVLRVTGFNAFVGLLYELIGAPRGGTDAVEPGKSSPPAEPPGEAR
jgi:MFS family permease